MVVEIQIKHDALTIFYDNYGAKSVNGNIPLNICMRMTCDSHTIPIPTMISLGLIPYSDSVSSVSQKVLIPILIPIPASCVPIPIPTNQALIPILTPESDSDFKIIYNSDSWFECSGCTNTNFLAYRRLHMCKRCPSYKCYNSLHTKQV